MKRQIFCILVLAAAIAIICGTSLSCSSGTSTNPPTSSQSGSAASLTPGSAGGSQTSAASAATKTGSSIAKPGGMPDIAEIKQLPSYRLNITSKIVEEGASGLATVIKYEWVRDSQAEHVRMEDGNGQVTMEYITIGEKRWIWMGMGGMGWVAQPPQAAATQPSMMPSDWQSQLSKAMQDVEHSKARFDKKGSETVNSVSCTRYEFEYSLSTDLPSFKSGGANKTDMHSKGDVWIAAQSGLPAVMVKSKSTAEITSSGKKSVVESEQNLTDIGAAITINPPQEVAEMPGTPSLPTGLPSQPPVTTTVPPPVTRTTSPTAPAITTPMVTTPPASTGGKPVFSDEFSQAQDSRWVWTDPSDDAALSLTARSGFLRLTVPDGNDLAGFNNYDAPRLLIPRKGNFTIETLVEFDPQEDYQGAGILVWQNEHDFLRLEFGFGGLGGGEKSLSFLEQRDGELGLVDKLELPDGLKRIELRLKREGDQFSAWCRQAGGDWQEAGSTQLDLASTVEVGITQVVASPSEISADFDYFRLFDK
jgi:regulation of enolase protein 1 (concanavalin A-like superfamily)